MLAVGKQTAYRASAALVIALSAVFYLLWEVVHRGVYFYSSGIYPIDDADEWRYTACSRLVEHGYALFSQVFSAQPPVLFLSLAGGMHVLGDSISGARPVEIAYGFVALLSSAWIAWLLAGPGAAAVTTVILSVSPPFLVYSHTIEAEGPMMALVTLSLALVCWYFRTGRPVLPVLAGLIMAAAVLTKLFALEAAAPALWLIASRQKSLRSAIAPFAQFTAAVLLPVVANFLLISPHQQWQQVIAMHGQAAQSSLPNLTSPLDVLYRFFLFDLGLSVLAAAGLATLTALGRRRETVFLFLWLGGSVAMLLVFRPLFPHHPAILVSSMAVAGGVGVAEAARTMQTGQWRPAAPVVLGVLLYLAFLPRAAHDDRHLLYAGVDPRRSTLSRYVAMKTNTGDMIVVDDVAIADLAGRLVPPPLCDPSNVRLHTGYLTAATLIQATQRYRPLLVLPVSGVYDQTQYLRWLDQHYWRRLAPLSLRAFWRK